MLYAPGSFISFHLCRGFVKSSSMMISPHPKESFVSHPRTGVLLVVAVALVGSDETIRTTKSATIAKGAIAVVRIPKVEIMSG